MVIRVLFKPHEIWSVLQQNAKGNEVLVVFLPFSLPTKKWEISEIRLF